MTHEDRLPDDEQSLSHLAEDNPASPSERPGIEATELLKRYTAGDRDFSFFILCGKKDISDLSPLRCRNLSGINLSHATVDGFLDFGGVNFSHADLSYITTDDLNFSRANLSYANLSGAVLVWCNFTETNLSYANLSGADLSSACFARANLTGVNLEAVHLDGTEFSGTTMPDGSVASGYLPGDLLNVIEEEWVEPNLPLEHP